MAKNTSKKIKELKGVKPEKISEDHLTEVQSAINNINKAQLDIGILETQKHNLLHQISVMQEEIGGIQKKLEKEYGTSDININDGTIKYPENGEADKKD